MFPATIRDVTSDGRLLLTFDHNMGEGEVEITQVVPRITMPWHPKFLRGQYTILLRRNLGRGRVLEGLELRWGLVSNILHALTKLGRWRLDGEVGPMHKFYDVRLFDINDELIQLETDGCGTASCGPVSCRTSEDTKSPDTESQDTKISDTKRSKHQESRHHVRLS